MENTFIQGDFRDNPPPDGTTLMIADPVYSTKMVYDVVDLAVSRKLPSCIFMYADDLVGMRHKPHQIGYWVKPVSTKNTVKRYSRFVEAITFWFVKFHKELHWSNRTGIFTDCLISNEEHPWKKPEILIERLILNHYPGYGVVYDPCAGSRTVESVCKKLGIPSFSVEIAVPAETQEPDYCDQDLFT